MERQPYKKPTTHEMIDLVDYYRSEQGQADWSELQQYVGMSKPDWSNTMSYLMTGKGPGDYGDRLD